MNMRKGLEYVANLNIITIIILLLLLLLLLLMVMLLTPLESTAVKVTT